MISVNDVHKSYTRNKETIKGVSFEVKDGMIFGLLGPNGAGKTTTFYMVVGIANRIPGQSFWTGRI